MRVPLVEGNQVSERGAPNARYAGGSSAPARVTLEQAARVTNAGADINAQEQSVLAKQQQTFDTAQVFQANARLQEKYNGFMEDMKQNKQGFNAQNVDAEFTKWFTQQKDEIGKTLTNPTQQNAFSQHATALGLQGQAQTGAWKVAQIQAAQDESYKAVVSTAATQAQNDPLAYGASIAHVTAATETYAATRGLDKVATDAAVQSAQSQVATGTALTLAQKSPDLATQFLKDKGDLLTPQVKAHVQSLIDAADFKAKFDDGMQKLNGMDEAAQQKYLDSVSDPKLRANLQSALGSNAAFTQQRKNQDEADALSNSLKLVTAGHTFKDVLHSDYWDQMSGEGQLRVEQLYAAKAKAGGDGFAPTITDKGIKVYAQLSNQAANGALDLNAIDTYKPFLTKDQYTKLATAAVENTQIPMKSITDYWRAANSIKPNAQLNPDQQDKLLNFAQFAQERAKSGEKESIKTLYSEYYTVHDPWGPSDYGSLASKGSAFSEPPPDAQQPLWDAASAYVAGAIKANPSIAKAFGTKPNEKLDTKTLRNHLYGQYGIRLRSWFARNGIAMTPDNIAAYTLYRTANPTNELSIQTFRGIKEHMVNSATTAGNP